MKDIDQYDLQKESFLGRMPAATHYVWPFTSIEDLVYGSGEMGLSTVGPEPPHIMKEYDKVSVQKPPKEFTGDKITFYQIREGEIEESSFEDSTVLTAPDEHLMVGTQVRVIDIVTDHVAGVRYAKFVPVQGGYPLPELVVTTGNVGTDTVGPYGADGSIRTFMYTTGPVGPAVQDTPMFYYIDLRALRKFSTVDDTTYKASISGYAPVPKQTYIYDLTSDANAENKTSFDGITSLTDVRSVYCKIEEDLRSFGMAQGVADRGPIHDVDLYYVCRIKGVDARDTFASALKDYIERETDPNLPLNLNTEYFKRLIYKAKRRAVMFLLADYGKIPYNRNDLFSTFDFDSEQITLDFFESLFFQNDFGEYDNLIIKNGVNQKEVLGRAVNSEAIVPKNHMKIKPVGKVDSLDFVIDYEINVFVRASFIHSFGDVDFDYNEYLDNNGGFTISSQSHRGIENFISDVELLPSVLEKFHEPIEAFKKENVVMVDMKEEIKRAKGFLTALDGFFHLRGQGGYTEGFSFGLQDSSATAKDQFIEIGLSKRMYPIFANATEHTYEKTGAMRIVTSMRPVNCNIGLVRLGLAVKQRTFGYILNLPKIIRWVRETGLNIGKQAGIQGGVVRSGKKGDLKKLRREKREKRAAKSRRHNYRLIPDEIKKEAGKANWLDFISRFTVPAVFIAADKDNIDAIKLERCLEKVKSSGVEKGSAGVYGPGFLDEECRELIFIDRKKAKQYVGDKTWSELSIKDMMDKLSLASLGDGAKAEIKKALIHHEVLNKIDIFSLIDSLIECISKMLGVDLSAQALCEVAIKALFGKEGFANVLNFLKDSREIMGALENLASIGAVSLDPASIPIEEPSSVLDIPPGVSAEEYAKSVSGIIDKALADVEDMSRASAAEMFSSAGAAAQELRSAESFIKEMKKLVDIRAVCAVLLAGGLDIPNLNLDFALPKLPKMPEIPAFPDMPIIIKFKEYDFWKRAKEIMLDVLVSQLTNFINSLLRQIIEQCLQADVAMGAPSRALPLDFGPITSPPYEVFSNYGLPDNRDRIREFLRKVFGALNAKEGCALLRGTASDTVLQTVQNIVYLRFTEYSARLDSKNAIQDFFISVGAIFNLDFCDLLGEASAAVDDICDEIDFYNQRIQDLIDQGLSEEEARNIIHLEIDANLQKLSALAEKSLRGPGGFFDGTAPKLDCSPGGIFPGIPPSLEDAKNNILDVLFDATKSGYNIDIDTIYLRLTNGQTDKGKMLGAAMESTSKKLFGTQNMDLEGNVEYLELANPSTVTLNALSPAERNSAVPTSYGTIIYKNDDFPADDEKPILKASKKRRTTGGGLSGLGASIVEGITPFSKLFDVLNEVLSASERGEILNYGAGEATLLDLRKTTQIYRNTEYSLRGDDGADASIVMKIPKIDLSAKQLLTGELKGIVDELQKAQVGNNAVSYEAIGDIIGELIEGKGTNDFSRSLVDFVDGDLKVSFARHKRGEETNKDVVDVAVSDVVFDMEDGDLMTADKVRIGATIEKDYSLEYLETLGDLGNEKGIPFTNFNYRRVFAEFMTFSIENKLPRPLGESQREGINRLFFDSYDKIIFDHFNQFNNMVLTSPIFEKKGFEKAFRKIFPGMDECSSPLQMGKKSLLQLSAPEQASTLVDFAGLKEYADERMADMLCKTFFDPSRLSNQGIKTIMSKAAMESLTAAYIRLEVLKYVMALMPVLPIFNLQGVFKGDLFYRNILEIMSTMEDETPHLHKILLDNCYRIERFKLRAGGGETSGDAGHHHTYEIDENGNGWAHLAVPAFVPQEQGQNPALLGHKHKIENYKIVDAKSECFPNCADMFGTLGTGLHTHELEEKHNLLSKEEAFEKVVKEQIDAMMPTVNNYFSAQVLDFGGLLFRSRRVENHQDFFKALIYPVYDPAKTFSGPFNYGRYSVPEAERSEYIGLNPWGEDLGTKYSSSRLMSTTQYTSVQEMGDGKGFFRTRIGRQVDVGTSYQHGPSPVVMKNQPADGPKHVPPYEGSMGKTSITAPGVIMNGSGFFNWVQAETEGDSNNEAAYDNWTTLLDGGLSKHAYPRVSSFGLFSVEPYIYVEHKPFLAAGAAMGGYGWGTPSDMHPTLETLITEAGLAYSMVQPFNPGIYFRNYVESVSPGEGSYYVGDWIPSNATNVAGPFGEVTSEIDSTRNESILSRLMKLITYDKFSSFIDEPGSSAGFWYEGMGSFISYASDTGGGVWDPTKLGEGLYSSRTNAYFNRFDDQGVSNLDFWGNEFPNAIVTANEQFKAFDFAPEQTGGGYLNWGTDVGIDNANNLYNVKLNQVFDKFCYGMRLVFNVTDDIVVKQLRNILTDFYTHAELKTFMLENKVFAQAEHRNIHGTEFEPAEQLAGGVQAQIFFERFTIELFDTKMPLHHGYKCLSKYKALVEAGQIDMDEPIGGLKFQNIIDSRTCLDLASYSVPDGAITTPLEVFRDHVVPVFHERLMNSNEVKLLFKHLFDYEELLPAYTQYVLMANKEVEPSTMFRASQMLIENFLVNMAKGEYLPEEMADMNNFYRTRSMAAKGVGAGGIDFTGMVEQLILATPLIILQQLVESFDPCVSISSSIQKYVRGIVGALIAAANMALAMAEQGKAMAKQAAMMAIGDAEALEAQVEIELKEILLDAGDYEMTEECNTTGTGENSITICTLIWNSASEGDYGGGEDDPTSPLYNIEERREAVKKRYDAAKAKVALAQNTVAAMQAKIEQADADAQAAINGARSVIGKVAKLAALGDPSILWIASLALLPSNAISSISGFPWPVGMGPPMSPFGLAHIILAAAGVHPDEINAELQKLIDKIGKEDEENCALPSTETVEE